MTDKSKQTIAGSDFGFCKTPDGKEGVQYVLKVVNSTPETILSLGRDLQVIANLVNVNGKPFRVYIDISSPEFFGPCPPAETPE